MNAQDCLNTLRKLRDVTFSTVSPDGKPQARIIDVMIAEEGRLIFCTSRGKDFHAQLMASGWVAVTGLTKDYKMIRLNGKAKLLPEKKVWIDRIFDLNPSMNDVYPGESRYILDPFCIDEGDVECFDLGVNPIERESFSFGGAEPEAKGFLITDACIGCGTCAAGCPQQAIGEGTPYYIRQRNCLHCGLCAENCPVQAIVRRGRESGT